MAFYERHVGGVQGWFERNTTQDVEAVQDLLAETFAQTLASLATFRSRGEGSASAWLYGIARNQHRHYHRKRRVANQARRRLGVTVAPEFDWDDEVERVLAEQVRPLLDAALEHLPPDQRAAVVLRIVREEGYPQIARSLGCSEQAARIRVSRGLRSLQATLASALRPEAQE